LFSNVSNGLKKFEFRPFSVPNYNKLVGKVSCIDWNALVRPANVNLSFELFTEKINALYCECFPVKVKYLSEKRLSKPWLFSFILSQIPVKII